MKIRDLLNGAEVLDFNGCENIDITGVTGNSKNVKSGYAFVCISGTKFDGHDFLSEVHKNGAIIAIVERIPEYDKIPYVLVKNTRFAASYIFANANGNPEKDMKIVGVTGTNGKTSSAVMLRGIFEQAGYKCGIIGTILNGWGEKKYEASMTTPDPENLYKLLSDMRNDNTEYVFMEVSSHSLALGRVEPITFEAAIYTNLTREHLDFHKTMDEYSAAKEILFTKSKLGVFNIDNSYVKASAKKVLCESVTYSLSDKNADYYADNIVYNSMDGVKYDIMSNGTPIMNIDTVVPGEISVYNTMGVALCALKLGVSPEDISKGLYSLTGVPGRMELTTPRGCPFSVIIDYAHTPDALENVAQIIMSTRRKNQKFTILFGCGGDRDKTKRPVMGEIATRFADFTVITSDNSRSEDPDAIIQDILKGIHEDKNHTVIVNRKDAISYVVANAVDGEIILIAGKGHENYEITKEGKKPFSEHNEVAQALQKRFGAAIDNI